MGGNRRRWVWTILAVICALAALLAWLRAEREQPAIDANAASGALTAAFDLPAGRSGRPMPAVGRSAPFGDLVLEGQVIDAAGLPASGALVDLAVPPDETARTTNAGPDGAFSFNRLVPGLVRLGARLEGLAAGPVLHQLTAASDPVILRLRPGTEVHVLLVAAACGRPIAGASVILEEFALREAVTGPDGIARFTGVRHSGCFVSVAAPGFASVRRFRSLPVGARAPVIIRLELTGGAPLTGIVRSAEGSPVAGAKVWAMAANRFSSVVGDREGEAVSDLEGRFEIAALPDGTYFLLGRHPEHAPGQAGPIRVDSVRPTTGIELRLGAAGVVRGRVVDSDGRPVPHALVSALPPQGSGRLAVRGGLPSYVYEYASREGVFELRGLPREQLVLVAATREALSVEVAVDLSTRPLVEGVSLVLMTGGRIAGQVVDGRGLGVAEVTVTALAETADGTDQRAFGQRRFQEVMTDGGGGFELTGLVDGTYLLRATRYAGRRPTDGAPIEARTGDRDVRLVLLDDGELRGQVVFADGTHPPRFEVTLGWGPALPFETPDGRFAIEHLTAGTYEVSVSGPTFASRQLESVEVEGGKATDLGEIQVEGGRRLLGAVMDEGGRPVESARVAYGTALMGDGDGILAPDQSEEDVNLRLTLTDREGRFTLDAISPGEGVVAAEHERLGRSPPEIVRAGREDVRVDIVLRATGSLEGSVRLNQQPVSGAIVEASPTETRAQQSVVMTNPDGSYEFQRLPAGRLTVNVSLRGTLGDGARQEIAIASGERARLDFDLRRGEVDLEVQLRPAPGTRVDEAAVSVIQASFQASTYGAMKAILVGLKSIRRMVNLCRPGIPCFFGGLEVNDYTVCGVRVLASQEYRDAYPVDCLPLHVASAPATQKLDLIIRGALAE